MLIICNSCTISEDTLKFLRSLKVWGKLFPTYTALKINTVDVTNIENIINKSSNEIDFIFMDNEDFDKLPEETQVDFVLNMAETGVDIYFTNVSKTSNIVNLINTFEIKNVTIGKNYLNEVDIRNLDVTDIGIIQEIFEIPVQGLNLNDFWTTLTISESKVVLKDMFEEEFTEALEDVDLKEIFLKVNQYRSFHNVFLMKEYCNYPFNFEVYQPTFQLSKQDIHEILEYKWMVFEEIKKLDATNMQGLPKEVITFCNKSEFIPYNDALSVVRGEYPFLKYYRHGGEN